MTIAYLGLGSNVGARREHLQAALDGLGRSGDAALRAASPVYETEAQTLDPDEEQRPFLNAVVEVAVDCSPERLLDLAHALERAEGRRREATARWAPRPLDVDLLVVGNETRHTERLTLPHPRLAERRFVLKPWADLAPDLVVPPPFSASVQTLLERCPDSAVVQRIPWTLSAATDAGEGG